MYEPPDSNPDSSGKGCRSADKPVTKSGGSGVQDIAPFELDEDDMSLLMAFEDAMPAGVESNYDWFTNGTPEEIAQQILTNPALNLGLEEAEISQLLAQTPNLLISNLLAAIEQASSSGELSPENLTGIMQQAIQSTRQGQEFGLTENGRSA